MKKKIMVSLCAGVILCSLLAGCAQDADNPSEDKKENNKVSSKKNEQVYAENLTAGLDTKIALDYEIESYEEVQSFAYDLFRYNIAEENPVLSPVSAYLALGMAGTGAEDTTLEEFQEVLGADMTCMPHYLMSTLPRDEEGMKIALANSVWVDDEFEANEDYLVEIDSYYLSEVYRANLSDEHTMDDMNHWIDNNTDGMIPVLLVEPLSEDSRLALFNTIYFKGDWLKAFSESATQTRDFSIADGSIEEVDMMHLYEEELQYFRTEDAEGVVLPYKGGDMAFVAMLPTNELSVREMYEGLKWGDIGEMISTNKWTLCNLQLPKFEVTFEKRLNESLQDMGLKRAFDSGTADLSGMGTSKDGQNIYIDLVFQKAVVIVDEKGTEAAAVTMVDVTAESCPMYEEPPVDIFFDRPFLYMIVDLEKEVPLFMGIMDNPNKQE